MSPGCTPAFVNSAAKLVRRLEQQVVVRDFGEGNALGARDVTGTLLGRRACHPVLYAVVERRVASIDDRDAALADVRLDVGRVDDDRFDLERRERAGARRREPRR